MQSVICYSNKVIGVRLFASVNNSEVDNYVQELLRILEEKYQRLCAKKAEDKWTMTFFDRVHEVDDRQEENLSVVAVIYVYIKRNQHDDSSAVVFLEAYDMLLDKEHRKIRSVLTDAEKEKEYQKAIKAL